VKRILIIGHPGSGKSTFATELGDILQLPVIHLDREFWQPGWQPTGRDVWRKRVGALSNSDTWIIDGTYDSTLDIRLPRADTVFFMDYPRYFCMWRIFKRYVTNFRRVRSDMADGCPERIDTEFLKFTWNYHRDHFPKIHNCLRKYYANGEQIVFKNPANTREYLREIAESSRKH